MSIKRIQGMLRSANAQTTEGRNLLAKVSDGQEVYHDNAGTISEASAKIAGHMAVATERLIVAQGSFVSVDVAATEMEKMLAELPSGEVGDITRTVKVIGLTARIGIENSVMPLRHRVDEQRGVGSVLGAIVHPLLHTPDPEQGSAAQLEHALDLTEKVIDRL